MITTCKACNKRILIKLYPVEDEVYQFNCLKCNEINKVLIPGECNINRMRGWGQLDLDQFSKMEKAYNRPSVNYDDPEMLAATDEIGQMFELLQESSRDLKYSLECRNVNNNKIEGSDNEYYGLRVSSIHAMDSIAYGADYIYDTSGGFRQLECSFISEDLSIPVPRRFMSIKNKNRLRCNREVVLDEKKDLPAKTGQARYRD